MLEYIRAVKRGLRDQHGFKPSPGSTRHDPILAGVPDGEYPMTIDGKLDRVQIVRGAIYCCRFDAPESR